MIRNILLKNVRNITNIKIPNSVIPTKNIQYISDLHVDYIKDINKLPDIKPISNNLIIAGDIGKPEHEHVFKFLRTISERFDKIFVVLGNHDYDCNALVDKNKFLSYNPINNELYNSFRNITLLDNQYTFLDKNTIIAGTTLWSNPEFLIRNYETNKKFSGNIIPKNMHLLKNSIDYHLELHNQSLRFLKHTLETNLDKNIIVVSHYVPSFKLIEKKYKLSNPIGTELFASNLDYIIRNPIKAWICGHTHSVLDLEINKVRCCINAFGYQHENRIYEVKNKLISY